MSDLAIDFSYADTLAQCPARFYYRYELGLEPKTRSLPLRAGSAIHAALHVLWHGWDVERSVAALYEAWGPQKPMLAPAGDFGHLTPAFLEVVLRNFAEQFPATGFEPIALDGQTLAEQPVVIEWDGMMIGGKPDLPVRKGGGVYMLDFKCTNAWVNDWWLSKFQFSHQLRTYMKLVGVKASLHFDGAYILGIYIGEHAADPPEKWKTRKSAPFKMSRPFLFQPAHIEETRAWYGATIATRDLYRSLDVWPQNPSDKCANADGNAKCEFWHLCSAHPRARTILAQERYVKRAPNGVLASGADSNNVED